MCLIPYEKTISGRLDSKLVARNLGYEAAYSPLDDKLKIGSYKKKAPARQTQDTAAVTTPTRTTGFQGLTIAGNQ